MRTGRLAGDLALLAEGVEVAAGFGLRTLEGLAETADLMVHSVYEPRSLAATPNGVCFTLLNPPLRMGAFGSIRAFWDGTALPPERAVVRLPDGPSRAFASIDARNPVTLPIGRRVRFDLLVPAPGPGRHTVRLELRSVAIPPLVWFEFEDEVGPVTGGAP